MSEYRAEKAKLARQCTKSLRELVVGYRALLEDALRGESVTLAQLKLLNAIKEKGDVSGATIARTCQITPQTLQGILARAEREGWITRATSQRNHRIITASLTKKGEAVLERGLATAAEIEAKIWHGVSADALERLNLTLGHGIANLHDELDAHRTTS